MTLGTSKGIKRFKYPVGLSVKLLLHECITVLNITDIAMSTDH